MSMSDPGSVTRAARSLQSEQPSAEEGIAREILARFLLPKGVKKIEGYLYTSNLRKTEPGSWVGLGIMDLIDWLKNSSQKRIRNRLQLLGILSVICQRDILNWYERETRRGAMSRLDDEGIEAPAEEESWPLENLDSAKNALTTNQRRVVIHLCEGKSFYAVAQAMQISVSEVWLHIRRIRRIWRNLADTCNDGNQNDV